MKRLLLLLLCTTFVLAAQITPPPGGGGGLVTNGTIGQGLVSNGAGGFGTPVSFAASATTDTTNASNIASGTLNTARLPSPFTSGAATGSTSTFATSTGALTSGHCVSIDASGNLVDAGAACGSGSGITNMTTGAGAPAASCTAPSTSNLALYTNTTDSTVWACVATNTWQKLLSVTGSGPYRVTGTTGTAPATPASGSVSCYFDSTSNTQVCLDSAGNAFTMVKADAGTAHNFLTAVSAAGVISKAQPSTSDLSDGASVAKTIGSGTASLGTSAISSGACATVVTVAATGVAATDAIAWTPNASIKAVTGYAPSTSGGLSVAAYPTAGNVNFDVCNWTASSITPGAVTLNWRVSR